MPKIFIYSENKKEEENLKKTLAEASYLVSSCDNLDELFTENSKFSADVVILDINNSTDNISRICRKFRLSDQSSDVQIILLVDKNKDFNNISQGADAYIQKPVNTAILLSTVNAHLRLKNHLDIFSANNSELAKRFYQLKVLYDTNSKLAGTLNRRKLINIMNEGLEQSISYSLASTLIINNSDDVTLIINSLYPITKRLEQALKLRAIITYKSMFKNNDLPINFNVNSIKTEINFKKDDLKYDLEVMRFSSIFAPISTQDKFFGTVEIMRDTDLSAEDSACFQTVVSQVALPLDSAILYEEIQEKNIRLVKLEKLKSEFVSIVSHELRTPLTAIKNSLDIMLSGKTGEINEKMSNFLNMGKRNVVRLAGIINDLLDLSKIEAGKMEYHFAKTNLSEPINNVLSTFKPMAIDRNVNLSGSINVDLADVYADSQKIEQVLSNLVSNALKFTNPDGNVEISLTEYSENENYYLISVSDTGIGINKENIDKVFDKFQQIESSLSRKVGGTGLGLPIAKELILTHKGKIWVESEENIGSKFLFTLPKFNIYTNFLIELELFYEKAKNANTNFGIINLITDEIDKIIEYLNSENKNKFIFNDDKNIWVITQPMNDNAFDVYLEKLQNFITEQNNDNILLKSEYCNFKEDKSFTDFLNSFENKE